MNVRLWTPVFAISASSGFTQHVLLQFPFLAQNDLDNWGVHGGTLVGILMLWPLHFETAAYVIKRNFSLLGHLAWELSAEHLMQTGLCGSNAEFYIEADEWPVSLKSSHKKVQFCIKSQSHSVWNLFKEIFMNWHRTFYNLYSGLWRDSLRWMKRYKCFKLCVLLSLKEPRSSCALNSFS